MIAAVLLLAGAAWAQMMDQAKPADPHAGLGMGGHGAMTAPAREDGWAEARAFAAQDRKTFQAKLQLEEFRRLCVFHNDQLKIIDSWARQSLSKIRSRQQIDGEDPVYTALDMAFRQAAWVDREIIYVQAIPIRQELASLVNDQSMRDRIMQKALVSPRFLSQPEVIGRLEEISRDTRLASSVNKVWSGLDTFLHLSESLALVAPASHGGEWKTVGAFSDKDNAGSSPRDLQLILAWRQLVEGFRSNDAELANAGMKRLSEQLPLVNPAEYREPMRREVEVWYNRTFHGTILNVFLYFIAMTLFLLAAIGTVPSLREPIKLGGLKLPSAAMAVFTIAVVIHLAVMLVRWWLAERIPIKNQFESVLGAALLGCLIAWGLEAWKKNSLFGLAMSFVGFLAMTACFASPYVFGHDLGAPIGKVAGILHDFWLYIHVNIVIASYALIGASFALGLIYLLTRLWHWINPIIEENGDDLSGGGGAGGVAVAVAGPMVRTESAALALAADRRMLLEKFDGANLVIMQMAFWFLGIGIICGAVWADHSWGRPWGWDPKETFALVTWIVYLIIVHLRFVTKLKADVTAWLSILGFAIMMFNWIGVNFFLAGLHSYA